MNTSLAYISVEIPTSDLSFLEQMAQRMGWKLSHDAVASTKSSIDLSLEEARRGEIKSFNSVDDLMKDLLE